MSFFSEMESWIKDRVLHSPPLSICGWRAKVWSLLLSPTPSCFFGPMSENQNLSGDNVYTC